MDNNTFLRTVSMMLCFTLCLIVCNININLCVMVIDILSVYLYVPAAVFGAFKPKTNFLRNNKVYFILSFLFMRYMHFDFV